MRTNGRFGTSQDFATKLGLFYINWTKNELLLDFAIGKFLGISAEQAHLITASIDFGRRAQWLRALVKVSEFPNKTALLTALNAIQNDSKRNIFAHSYLSGDEKHVWFVERIPFGEFSIRAYRFDADEFGRHVDNIAEHGVAFQNALQVPDDELDAFAQAALNMAAKVTVSPEPPKDKAP
jgi:hypothetical protein